MLTVYTTAPSCDGVSGSRFRRLAVDAARWTEAAGYRGLLVYTDNTLVDPWQVAQLMIEHTESIVPLVAVQPLFRHPFDVARAVSSLGFQYGRQVDLNLVTGGFARHMYELGDTLDHDGRYLRLLEYGRIIGQLLAGRPALTHQGEFYDLKTARLTIPLPGDLTPRTYLSGSSEACIEAARLLGAARLFYPRFIADYAQAPDVLRGNGIRLGIIARESTEQAWRVAHGRFPDDQLGEQLHDLAADAVESAWHRKLSAEAQRSSAPREGYWLYPFRAYKTFCPYLVGSYQEVAQLFGRYLRLGISALILDVPHDEDDLHHAGRALRLAERAHLVS
ncbi:LLM class flavin-dependent oxidoreductase [Catenulispora sp. NF23]|uniref:LLM class flavin-dependent oxidoreductase n=1 Tax=Catenulispora pinistramenti TaxID=2705254 RepID=A0ABS5KL78_9ACTN|nr:LLM class flavin-dependent oxidoreductase [Catenulispora pinistramenti]MBS2531523.1 LLM class flavin-dependent oxidoreductase [Catenulispora pinistramenti]MBS2546792.1 LLM class flavin-dependent oxidoreductase [Catenulispora pinistramenti]